MQVSLVAANHISVVDLRRLISDHAAERMNSKPCQI